MTKPLIWDDPDIAIVLRDAIPRLGWDNVNYRDVQDVFRAALTEIERLRAKIEELERPLREHAEIYGRRSGGMKEHF